MIEAQSLTKRYGPKLAVDGLSFTVRPGQVTGFLGPNGAGKSTTMRMMVGLDRPTSGEVRIDGRPFAQHAAPLHVAGALLEARAVHPGRSARAHLLALGLPSGIGRRRVEEVLDLVGLSGVARQRVGSFSLGMGQRLGIAAALLGDPQTLILDEPVNGLDLDGIRWIRALLRGLAAEGRTVFLSSHLMSEMSLTADHVIVVGRGRLLRDQTMASFIDDAAAETVRVVTPDVERLRAELSRTEATVEVEVAAEPAESAQSVPSHLAGSPSDSPTGSPEALRIGRLSAREIGELAARAGITLWELAPSSGSLEEAYLALTRDSVDHQQAGEQAA